MKKIALPVNSQNQIDGHFGHCEYYGIYTISDNNEILDIQSIKSDNSCGCKSDIAGTLSQNGVKVMLAGGIGAGAINVLNSWGIEVIRGCSGSATETVEQYLKGNIIDSGDSCTHHEHHHGHNHN